MNDFDDKANCIIQTLRYVPESSQRQVAPQLHADKGFDKIRQRQGMPSTQNVNPF